MFELGCIADDLTGATDLGVNLAAEGMRVLQLIGAPSGDPDTGLGETADAVIVALKSRTCEVQTAVSASRAGADWLLESGARRLYFKYCSTFDSRPTGNIGPVTMALMEASDGDLAVVCPASPENGRTVRDGRLLVHGVPLAETHMRHHPLTPMTESNVAALMDAQTGPGHSGLVKLETVRAGADNIAGALDALRAQGRRFAVCDAETETDLEGIAAGSGAGTLLTGAAGLGRGFARHLGRTVLAPPTETKTPLPDLPGHVAILSGSCSARSLEQVRHAEARMAAMRIDVSRIADAPYAERILAEAIHKTRAGNLLVYSTAGENERQAPGDAGLGERIETFHARLAAHLKDAGTRKFIVAGGETAGSVVRALGVSSMMIGDLIDPGVPWTVTTTDPALLLACKSGNFGAVDFFTRAVEMVS
ncbi:MAG: four-carbon acid sugar kinase family protein [Lysobacterales bacterium]|jgi:uncharacterized protein YgbK (DUF1537 family)